MEETSLDLSCFEENETEISVRLTSAMRDHIARLGYEADTSSEDVARTMLFEALYGKAALHALNQHAQRLKESQLAACETAGGKVIDGDQIRSSRDRATRVDLEHVGKADTALKIHMPRQMLVDLSTLARRTDIQGSVYVRGMLFKAIYGEKPHADWQQARILASQ